MTIGVSLRDSRQYPIWATLEILARVLFPRVVPLGPDRIALPLVGDVCTVAEVSANDLGDGDPHLDDGD